MKLCTLALWLEMLAKVEPPVWVQGASVCVKGTLQMPDSPVGKGVFCTNRQQCEQSCQQPGKGRCCAEIKGG
jgi:hypothetical protein